jgi:hypothetical protein
MTTGTMQAVTVFCGLIVAGSIVFTSISGFRALWDLFGPDLIVEGIGIFLTVFIIDRLIKRREQQREEQLWLPTRQLLYDKLLNAIDNLLLDTLPPDFRTEDGSSGRLFVALSQDIRDPDMESLLLDRRVSELMSAPHGLEEDPAQATQISTTIYCKNLQLFFGRARRVVNEVLDSSAFPLDPELANLLHTFEQKLANAHAKAAHWDYRGLSLLAIPARSLNDVSGFERLLRPLVSVTVDVVRAAVDVKAWVESHRD